MAAEDIALLIRVTAVFWALRKLSSSAIALRYELLTEFAYRANPIVNTLSSLDTI